MIELSLCLERAIVGLMTKKLMENGLSKRVNVIFTVSIVCFLSLIVFFVILYFTLSSEKYSRLIDNELSDAIVNARKVISSKEDYIGSYSFFENSDSSSLAYTRRAGIFDGDFISDKYQKEVSGGTAYFGFDQKKMFVISKFKNGYNHFKNKKFTNNTIYESYAFFKLAYVDENKKNHNIIIGNISQREIPKVESDQGIVAKSSIYYSDADWNVDRNFLSGRVLFGGRASIFKTDDGHVLYAEIPVKDKFRLHKPNKQLPISFEMIKQVPSDKLEAVLFSRDFSEGIRHRDILSDEKKNIFIEEISKKENLKERFSVTGYRPESSGAEINFVNIIFNSKIESSIHYLFSDEEKRDFFVKVSVDKFDQIIFDKTVVVLVITVLFAFFQSLCYSYLMDKKNLKMLSDMTYLIGINIEESAKKINPIYLNEKVDKQLALMRSNSQFSEVTLISDSFKKLFDVIDLRNNLLRLELEMKSNENKIIGHEILSPLQSLKSMLQMDEKAQSKIDRIIRAINKIQDSKKIEDAFESGNTEILDLNEVLDQYCKNMTHVENIKYTRVTKPILIKLDPDGIEQSLDNIISNADTYRSQGTPIEISLCTVGNFAILDISNYGPKIEEKRLDKIFNYGETSSEDCDQNLGQGLFVVKRMLMSLEGSSVRAVNTEHGVKISMEFKTIETKLLTKQKPQAVCVS